MSLTRFLAVALVMIAMVSRGTVFGEENPGREGWVLQFSDDFNRLTLHAGAVDMRAPDWQPLTGNWRIEDGMLRGDSDASIMLLLRFPGDQRVEYDAIATDDICDLSAILATGERGGYHGGYFFGFGSDHNQFSRLLVRGQEVKRYDVRITPGKVHHIICQREGTTLTHIIDGQVVATYEDNQPMTGAAHEAVGFYIFGTGKIDNVNVYTKGQTESQRFKARPDSTAAGTPGNIPVNDPLFEELFGEAPGPTQFFSYGGKYDPTPGSRTGVDDHRQTARRFGARYVIDEQLDEAAKHNMVVYGRLSNPEYAKRGIATHSRWVEPGAGNSYFYLPDDTLPKISGGGGDGWVLDPRYQPHLVRELEKRAREGEAWGIHMFDELWSYYVVKPVPRHEWYEQVIEADREVRAQYGYGKFGIPETHEGGKPLERIAYRRWAADKFTETFAKAYQAAKTVNPQMKVIGPTEGSSGSSGDHEAWAPFFDIMGGQCAQGGTSAYFDSVRVGAVTKMYVDLARSQTPIWMMVHACVRQAARRTPQDIQEAYSQVFRNGGGGLWLMHSEFFEAELEDAMFAEPARWRTMLHLTDVIRNMKLPKPPEADCAILWSSDSMHTELWGQFWGGDNDKIISAYTILGPMLRSWFHFVSDRHVDRDMRDLNDYKVVYVPFAVYQRASVVDRLTAYVEAGGTVVCTDTDAFTWNLDGEKHGERWEKVAGVRKVSPREEASAFMTVEASALPLASPVTMRSLLPGWNIEPLNDRVEILARFEDGAPAVTMNAHGQGRVIFFAADPLYATDFFRIEKPYFSLYHALDKQSLVTPDAGIVSFVKAIQESAGAQMGRDIWRFTLPLEIDPYQKEMDVCLTGNYVFDVNEPLLEPNNLQTGGSYAYSRAPDAIPDVAGAGEPIALTEGKLTNRLKAYQTRQRFGPRERDFERITPPWVVSWKDAAPIAVTFDLQGNHPLTKLRLFHSGTMPALTVNVSNDGRTWEPLGTTAEQSAGLDVKDVVVPLRGSHRHVRLDFAARGAGEVFELSEVEIWGTPAR